MMAGYLPYYFVYLEQLKDKNDYRKLLKEVYYSRDVLWKYFVNKIPYLLGLKKEININKILNNEFSNNFYHEDFPITNNNLKRRLIEDIFSNSLQSLLRYEDRNSMRFSIEGRVPFLDFNLMFFIFSLPDEAIIKGGWNKYILREAVKNILPDLIIQRRNKIGFTTPEDEWFIRMKNRIYTIFASEPFGKRKYFNQEQTLKAFQMYIEGKNDDSMLFWRLLNLELWLREFFGSSFLTNQKFVLGNPNIGKKIEIEVDGKTYKRYPVKTELFKKGDNYVKKISEYVMQSSLVLRSISNRVSSHGKWFVVISEKIVAIAQGRSYFIWDIKTGFWANMLSKYVKKTPYGIGLGSPWTMQLAINELGLPRILFASIVSVLTKPFGIQGMFYHLAGREAAAIDGPTEYSVYPSNVSAKLAPKNPQKVAEEIHKRIKNFQGVVIIDANDIGQNVLGNSTGLPNSLVEKIFKDNPMGQGSEQTPIVVVSF
jgi:asparagine synthase (glutamine-hydrolysing)